MAFIGSLELILLEIGTLAFVGLGVPQVARQFIGGKYKYAKLTEQISWAPPAWLFGVVWSIMYMVVMPIAVYRVRLLGNWVSGVNLSALVVFSILQFVLLLYNFLYVINLWVAFFSVLASLGVAIATTWLFFGLDTFSGVLLVFLDLWLLFASALALAIAIGNRECGDVIAGHMVREATWGGAIGNILPPASANSQKVAIQRQQKQQQQQAAQRQPMAPQPNETNPPPRTVRMPAQIVGHRIRPVSEV